MASKLISLTHHAVLSKLFLLGADLKVWGGKEKHVCLNIYTHLKTAFCLWLYSEIALRIQKVLTIMALVWS